jgi:hypothetical protein
VDLPVHTTRWGDTLLAAAYLTAGLQAGLGVLDHDT